MTKYVLVGGHPWKTEDEGKAFVEELVEGFPDPVKVLLVPYARTRELWPELLEKDSEFFSKHLPRTKLEIRLATPEEFPVQVRWANVVYLKGGSAKQLVSAISADPTWVRQLPGKTLAGSSAGADAIARYYFGLSHPGLRRGLGLLPISVLVHYRSDYNAPNVDWDKAEAELKTVDEHLEFVPLREGEFRVFKK